MKSTRMEDNCIYAFRKKLQIVINQLFSSEEIEKNSTKSTTYFEGLYNVIKLLLVRKFAQIVGEKELEKSLSNKISNTINYSRDEIAFLRQELLESFSYSLTDADVYSVENQITPGIFSVLLEEFAGSQTKKNLGQYYSSKQEVIFMCKEALLQYLVRNSSISLTKVISAIWSEDESIVYSDWTQGELLEMEKMLHNCYILDPAIGSGIFYLVMTDLIYRLASALQCNLDTKSVTNCFLKDFLTNRIFGLDISEEALDIVRLRLFFYYYTRTGSFDYELLSLRSLQQTDFLVDTLAKLQHQKNRQKCEHQKPNSFDIIIGNPPYIRQELFVKQASQKTSQLSHVSSIREYKNRLIAVLSELLEKPIPANISLKSDFYLYFFYKALAHLKEKGVLCFITSNSWLDATFGQSFKKYLLENFQLVRLYSNLSQKSFAVDVNTAITIIANDQPNHKTSQVSFISIRVPYNEVLSKDFVQILHTDRHTPASNFSTRRLVIPARELQNKDHSVIQFVFRKWNALYLRAPDFVLPFLKKISQNLTPLRNLGHIRYPVKTGLNRFFYLEKQTAKETFAIEDQFLVPVIKSPKKVSTILLSSSDCTKLLFDCRLSLEELLERRNFGALGYIKWAEKQRTRGGQQRRKGTPWPAVTSVKKHRPFWYSVRRLPKADIFLTRFFDRRYFFCYSNELLTEDQTFYGIILNEKNEQEKKIVTALLNTTLSYFLLELLGRSNLGRGVLQFSLADWKDFPVIDPTRVPGSVKQRLLEKFDALALRPIESIFKEIKKNDRLVFDEILFEWLGLSKKEQAELYACLLEMVTYRLEKSGQSVRKLPC